MSKKQLTIELAIACCLSAILVHTIPVGYNVSQTYLAGGNLGPSEKIQPQLISTLQEQLKRARVDEKTVKQLQCTRTSAAKRYACTLNLFYRTKANRLSQLLGVTIPSTLGWISPATLRARIQRTQKNLTTWDQEIVALGQELQELLPFAEKAEEELEELQREKSSSKTDLANRKRQLEILEEAIPKRTAQETLRRFETKRSEVLGIIGNLRQVVKELDQKILSFSIPVDRKAAIEERLPTRRAQMDLAKAQLASWQPLLIKNRARPKLADPNTFQLTAVTDPGQIMPIRSWHHLPWSFPLGLFFLALIRQKKLTRWRESYFQTAEEVVSETELPFLGPI